MDQRLNYNLPLPRDVNSILKEEFFMIEHVGADLLKNITEPMKFSANTWIFVRSGKCRAAISLVEHEISGPTFVSVPPSHIMIPRNFDEDFDAAFMVFSSQFYHTLSMSLDNTGISELMVRHPVVKIPEGVEEEVENSLKHIRKVLNNSENPYGTQAVMGEVMAMLYGSLYKCYDPYRGEDTGKTGRMVAKFRTLAQSYYKTERWLEFYASKIGVTPKYLSRTVKAQTGYTATEWLERFVILEAKVLLKSTNMTIQQIAEELNFQSQSLFGKYFKSNTGISPREFRNS